MIFSIRLTFPCGTTISISDEDFLMCFNAETKAPCRANHFNMAKEQRNKLLMRS